ncbi:DUF3298 and DUF4163 domain-containing protein [Winogradskyella pulchriflava]|uniref:DUF3298 domain-containing protein n=1 Tax=Winogradskyella pulchriflava TaxID=1110688 RepID=A0ABV6Q4Q9_9FLAO
MKQSLIFFVFLCLLNSCNSEFKPASFKTTSVDTAYEAEISATYDNAVGNDELSETINFNIEKGIITTLSDAAKKTNLDSVLSDFNSEYVKFKSEFPDEADSVWELHIETEKIYQSEAIITIAINTYEFKGGAHGNDKIKFLNLDAKTGNVLGRSDIIKNIDAFKKLAKSHFLKSLNNKDDALNTEALFFGKPFQLPENIGFSDDGLVLLYNVYEIASYDQGYTEFVIPFSEAESHLLVH